MIEQEGTEETESSWTTFESRSMRWRQFTLRNVLLVVTCVCIAMSVWRWYDTRHMRALQRVVQRSDMSDEDKRLLTALAANKTAWKSGLIDNVAGGFWVKRIAWQSQFKDENGKTMRVFILDPYHRRVADLPHPPTCVLTNERYALLVWQEIAYYSVGFIGAELSSENNKHVLEVETAANWFHGKGIHQFRLDAKSITHIDSEFTKYDEGDPVEGDFLLHLNEAREKIGARY